MTAIQHEQCRHEQWAAELENRETRGEYNWSFCTMTTLLMVVEEKITVIVGLLMRASTQRDQFTSLLLIGCTNLQEPVMEVVDITDKFMLEVMFIRLQLPAPQFFCCKDGERFAVTIKFRPRTQHQRHNDEPMQLCGYSYRSPEDAMDVAAARVIRYMETVRGKVMCVARC